MILRERFQFRADRGLVRRGQVGEQAGDERMTRAGGRFRRAPDQHAGDRPQAARQQVLRECGRSLAFTSS